MLPAVIDVQYRDGIRWEGAAGQRRAALQLMRAFQLQVDEAVGPLLRGVFTRALAGLHNRLGAQFGAEIDGMADAFGLDSADVLVANLSYDLNNAIGCTTFASASEGKPLHARNLDWAFPGRLLRRHTCIIRVHDAPCGDYALVTWPGFFGALTAVAPGRFSVTVNHVTHRKDSTVVGAVGRALAATWPVPWAVRTALDQADDFAEAVKILSRTPLMSPVLFTVAGVRPMDMLIIERGAYDYALRGPRGGAVLVTNHYVTHEYKGDNVALEEMDTPERLMRLERLIPGKRIDASRALRVLSHSDLLGDTTQHQVVMCTAEGTLLVRVPGSRAVTVPLS